MLESGTTILGPGETIPILGRILECADAYQAMSEARPWREALTAEAAARELRGMVRGCVPAGQLGALVIVAHAQEFETDRFDAEFGFTLAEGAQPDLRHNKISGGSMHTEVRLRRPPRVFAVILILIGLTLAAGGVRLVTLGGSFYYVLAGLSEQPDHTMRISELAGFTNAELSRLSHLITRLQKRGYVRRRPNRRRL